MHAAGPSGERPRSEVHMAVIHPIAASFCGRILRRVRRGSLPHREGRAERILLEAAADAVLAALDATEAAAL